MAQIYFDTNRRMALLTNDNGKRCDYVQHLSGTVQLMSLARDKFNSVFTAGTSKKTGVEIAKDLLALAKTGVSVTPAARFALEQVICKPTTQEAPMAVPTSTPTSTKKTTAPKKVKAEAPTTPQKLSEVEVHIPKESVTEKAPATTGFEQTKKVEAEQFARSDKNEKAETPVSDLVTAAKAKAEQMVEEAKAALEEAKAKYEAKLAAEAAKAEAEKILAAAKKEVEKIKKEVAKLGGKRNTRKPKSEDGEKATRTRNTEDISGCKIKQLEEIKVREGSAAGLITEAICGCKTVAEAMEFEGVTFAKIRKLADKGVIALS